AGAFTAVAASGALSPPPPPPPVRPQVPVPPPPGHCGAPARLAGLPHLAHPAPGHRGARDEEAEGTPAAPVLLGQCGSSRPMARLVSVDLFISYWRIGPVAHTFVSFNLDDGTPPVCVSIEIRPEVGEEFDPLAAMFKQFELIYVVGDERDLVRVRTDHRGED